MQKFRSKIFNLVLYPTDKEHVKAIDFIKKNYSYAMILHNKDFNENGELKKEHYHIIIKFDNAHWSSALAKDLNINECYIEPCRNIRSSVLYLIHYNDPDKAQYELDDVTGDLKAKLTFYLTQGDKSNEEKLNDIIELIDKQEGFINYGSFTRLCIFNGYANCLRFYWNMVTSIIDYHNKFYQDMLDTDDEKVIYYS